MDHLLPTVSTPRIPWIDAARGFGILFIVFGHVVKDGALRTYLYAFHLPFFFFLSGLTYRRKPAREFYSRKAKQLLVPYVLFSIVSILIFRVLGDFAASVIHTPFATTEILPNLAGMLYGNSRTGYMKWNLPLWFLPCLFVQYVPVDGLERLLSGIPNRKTVRTMRLIFIGIAFLWGVFVKYVFPGLILPFSLETAVFAAGFTEAGILFRDSRRMSAAAAGQKKFSGIVCLFLLSAGALVSRLNGSGEMRTMQPGRSLLLFGLSSVLIGGGVLLLSGFCAHSRVLRYIGQHTLEILVMHKFPVLFFQTVLPFTEDLLLRQSGTPAGTLCGIAVTLVSVGMCLFAARVIDGTAPWIFGRKP